MTPTESPNESIALLIDADNAPAAKIDFIIAELATYGVVNIRRAYGNWKKPELIGWEKVLHEYAIQPVQHFATLLPIPEVRRLHRFGRGRLQCLPLRLDDALAGLIDFAL